MNWRTLIVWDGLVPFAMGGFPALICRLCGERSLAALTAAVLTPVLAALFRTVVGTEQLARAGPPQWLRSSCFVAAIAVLFAGEMLANLFQLSPNLPREVWLAVSGLFLVYFGLITLAFKFRRVSE